ncbi:MAG: metallopeptidase TldD-related protein [Gammaproteobacteria bacterium]|nr:metallopeptidase TldD-related protein [Gammaproteobacteria bacterium]
MGRFRIQICALLFASATLAGGVHAQSDEDDVLLRALQDEMARTLSDLRLDLEPPPYFVAYTVSESKSTNTTYVLGAHNGSNESRGRFLSVVVRVGTPELDNTNFTNFGGGFFGGSSNRVPLTASYDELRRVIWLATDAAYKRAVADLAAKKAALEQQTISDRPNDFSEEETFTHMGDNSYDALSIEELSQIAQVLSSAFRGMPDLHASVARLTSVANKRMYLDSEGNFSHYETGLCTASMYARTQTLEGAGISDGVSFYSRSCEDLPAIDEMKSSGQEMAMRLVASRSAEALDNYNGPVLLEEQAAAEFLSQNLIGRLGAEPSSISNNPNYAARQRNFANPFLDRVNARVFPRFLSVVNDPTLLEFEGNKLLGHYVVDNQGMPSRRVELISNGMLKALLTSRSPTKSFENSTGSSRGSSTPAPGNLFIEAKEGMSNEELNEELLTLADEYGLEYGLVLRKIMNPRDAFQDPFRSSPFQSGSPPALDLVKLYPDGSEVPVLPMTVSNFVVSFFKDIIAVSEDRFIYDVPLATGGLNFATIVTPSLLFEDLSMRSAGGAKPKLPLFPHPFAGEAGE